MLEAAIRHPPVAHQHAGEVGAEHRRGVGEPATVADGVDGRLRRGECPQPVAHGVHTPAGLIRCDHRTVADLLAQRRVGRRRRGGRAVQQMDQTARRHRQSELRPQNAGDLLQRHAQLGVQLDDQRGDVRTQLRAGRAQRIGGLQRVATLHPPPTLRAAAHLDLEVPHDRLDRRQVLLVLRRHAGHLDLAAAVRTRRRNRRRMRLVNPCRPPPAAMRAVIGAGPPARTPAASLRPVLGEGGRLPLAGAPGRGELLLQVFTVTLPVIPLLDQAFATTLPLIPLTSRLRQVPDQPRVLSLEVLDAHVPRVQLVVGAVRTATVAARARHTSLIGTRSPDLHPTSQISRHHPLNQDT